MIVVIQGLATFYCIFNFKIRICTSMYDNTYVFLCIIQVLFFPPSVSAVVLPSVFDAVVRFRRNKRQQPGKQTDKNL